MKTLQSAALVVFLLVSSQTMAVELSQCVSVDAKQTGGVHLRNTCNKKLNVTYCVENSKSPFSCAKRGFGMKTLSPGAHEFIPFYAHDCAGRIHWAACVYPDGAAGWEGPGRQYDCR